MNGGGTQTTTAKRALTKKYYGDSTDIVIFNIPVTNTNDSFHNDNIDDVCSARFFTILQHRLDYAFTSRLIVIALTLTLHKVCIADSIVRCNTGSLRRFA